MSRTALVVIATYCRHDHIRECLRHLARQTVAPERTVVVDASPDERTRIAVAEFPGVDYRRNDLGRGHTATSRAIGIEGAKEDILVFLDDDAYAEPEWLERILAAYDDPSVAGVGGRARNGQPGEENEGIEQIGLLREDGALTGFFAADPGRRVDVDHLLGANMSVRADTVRELGGIRDYYPGTCLREETDIALRMRKAGYRLVFDPAAVVLHVAGTYAKGRRFDLRYRFYGARNHVVLLTTTLGRDDPRTRRYRSTARRAIFREAGFGFRPRVDGRRRSAGEKIKAVGGGVIRSIVDASGLVVGTLVARHPVDYAQRTRRR